jgi:alcohol dehydrogenase class IV
MEVVGRGKAITRPSLPFIAVPTTAGTGYVSWVSLLIAAH